MQVGKVFLSYEYFYFTISLGNLGFEPIYGTILGIFWRMSEGQYQKGSWPFAMTEIDKWQPPISVVANGNEPIGYCPSDYPEKMRNLVP